MNNKNKRLLLTRVIHRWLMLFLAIQFVLWIAGGVYFSLSDIHEVHGEELLVPAQASLHLNSVNLNFDDILERYPDAQRISLGQLEDKPVYRFLSLGNKYLVDANTGSLIPAITESQVRQLAQSQANFNATVKNVTLLSDSAPPELWPGHLPVWQVEFEGLSSPTFYISQEWGTIVTKRHLLWRAFDWMWRLHIMDYDDGENVANWLLTVFSIFAIFAAISGLLLTYYRFFGTSAEPKEEEMI